MVDRAYLAELEHRAPGAFEWAARLLYEEFNGKDSWIHAEPEDRSSARQCVRQMLATLAKHGLRIDDCRATEPPVPFPARPGLLQRRRA